MRRFRGFVLSLFFVGSSMATPVADSLFAEGNAAYDAGDFDGAVRAYESVLDQDVWDGYLLYNLGNAHHKAGDLGRAILSYERAARLMPRSRDLQENLDYLRVLCKDRVDDDADSAIVDFVDRLRHSLTLDEAAGVFMTLWLLIGALAAARILVRSARARDALARGLAATGVLCAAAGIHLGLLWSEVNRDTGIIVAPEVSVRSGPGDDYVTEFKLHAGSRVAVQRRAGEWVQVSLSDELRGWCESTAVEAIRPAR